MKQINLVTNDSNSLTGIKLRSVKYFKIFKSYGETFYIHNSFDDKEIIQNRYRTSHEIGLYIKGSDADTIEKSCSKARYLIYKAGKEKLLECISMVKTDHQNRIVNKLKGIKND